MSYTSQYNLNIRVSGLEGLVNNLISTNNLNGVLTNGNSAGTNDIDMNGQDILDVNNIDLTTINGSAYPPGGGGTLQNVLTAGDTSDLSIILQDDLTTTTKENIITATDITLNDITTGVNSVLTRQSLTITDGTTTNTITKNGMTTHNTNQNTTHFLNFVANSTTGTGQIQKTSGIECNPSTKTLSATTFEGNLVNARYNNMLSPYGYKWASWDNTQLASAVVVAPNLVAGQTYVFNVWLPKGLVITNIGFWFNVLNSGTITGSQLGIYSTSGVSPALLASTAVLGASTPTGINSYPLSSPYTILTSGMYGIAINRQGAGNLTTYCVGTGNFFINFGLSAVANRLDGFVAGSTASGSLANPFAGTLASFSYTPCLFFT
jgi:hypothetical protein